MWARYTVGGYFVVFERIKNCVHLDELPAAIKTDDAIFRERKEGERYLVME
jgi:hypothetical protein